MTDSLYSVTDQHFGLIKSVIGHRPVLLTTTTTVLGLMPMALKLNIDFVNLEYSYNSPDTQWWVDLSRAIVFGLIFSTFLTLLVTPSALMLKSKYLGISSKKSRKVKK